MEKWEIRPPLPQKNPEPILPLIYMGDYHYSKFHHDTITPFAPKYAKMRIKWLS